MIVVHGFPMSPNTRRALIALEECGAPYRLEIVDLMSGQQRSPEYRKLNPTGRVPTLVDDDVTLWESNAILQYLADLFPDKLFRGKTAAARAETARWMYMNAAHLSPGFARVFAHSIRLPEAERVPAIVAEGRAAIERCLGPVDAHLAGREYIADEFGIADISLGPTLVASPMLGVSLDAAPNVVAWLERLAKRDSWKKVYG